MKFLLILSFCIFACVAASAQRDYRVYQYQANDTANKQLCKIVTFNVKGFQASVESIGYKDSALQEYNDFLESYFYNDTLLVKTITIHRNSEDKSIRKLKYNSKNQLIKETLETFEIRMKKVKRKTLNMGCTPEFDKSPTWKTESKKYFTYNSRSQQVETYAPKLHLSSQNRYLYYYNYEGILNRVTSLEDDTIIWEEFRQIYNKADYDYIRLWRNEYDFTETCRSVGKMRLYYNEKEQLIQKTYPDETGIRGDVKNLYYYNSNNQLIKEQRFNTEDKLEITHLYVYD